MSGVTVDCMCPPNIVVMDGWTASPLRLTNLNVSQLKLKLLQSSFQLATIEYSSESQSVGVCTTVRQITKKQEVLKKGLLHCRNFVDRVCFWSQKKLKLYSITASN